MKKVWNWLCTVTYNTMCVLGLLHMLTIVYFLGNTWNYSDYTQYCAHKGIVPFYNEYFYSDYEKVHPWYVCWKGWEIK